MHQTNCGLKSRLSREAKKELHPRLGVHLKIPRTPL